MALELTPFDASEYLTTPEARAAYLDDAMREGDAAGIAEALGTIARAYGMTALERDSGVPRATLYKALSPTGSPELATVLKVAHGLGLRLSAAPAEGITVSGRMVEMVEHGPPRATAYAKRHNVTGRFPHKARKGDLRTPRQVAEGE